MHVGPIQHHSPVFCRLGWELAGGGKLKDLACRAGGVSWLMLLVLFRHSTARRLRHALWQFTPQTAPGSVRWREKEEGRERFRNRGEWEGRWRGRERRRDRRRDGQKREENRGWAGETERGSDGGTGPNRNLGADGKAGGDGTELRHAMQTHGHLHMHTVRSTVPNNSSAKLGESKWRGATDHRSQRREIRLESNDMNTHMSRALRSHR